MTAQNALDGQPTAPCCPKPVQCFHGIFRAGRSESTAGRKQGRNPPSIPLNESNQAPFDHCQNLCRRVESSIKLADNSTDAILAAVTLILRDQGKLLQETRPIIWRQRKQRPLGTRILSWLPALSGSSYPPCPCSNAASIPNITFKARERRQRFPLLKR